MLLFSQIILGAVIEALVLLALVKMVARGETDESFNTLAIISAVFVAVAWLMTQFLLKVLTPLPVAAIVIPVAAILAGWLLIHFCQLSIKKGLIIVVLLCVINVVLLTVYGLVHFGSLEALREGEKEEEPVAAGPGAAAVKQEPAKEYTQDVKNLADLKAWAEARLVFSEQLRALRTRFVDRSSPLRLGSIRLTSELRMGQEQSSRQMYLELRGATHTEGGEERISEFEQTIGSGAALGDYMKSAKLRSARILKNKPVTVFVIDGRYKPIPIDPQPDDVREGSAERKLSSTTEKYLPPADTQAPSKWAAQLVKDAAKANGMAVESAQKLRSPGPVNTRYIRIVTVRALLEGEYDHLIALLEDLEKNPYFAINGLNMTRKSGQPLKTELTLQWPILRTENVTHSL